MDEQGIDRALMFPTLASLVEERMRDDPELIHAVIHALNEWIHETWQFNYEDRIFATPVITLPIVDKAIEELEWVRRARRQGRADPPGARARASAARGRSACPSSTRSGRRSSRHDILVGHALVRQRLRALRQRVDGQRQRDAAVPAAGLPHAVGVASDRGRGRRRWSATARCRASRSSRWRSSRTAAAGSSRC